MGGYGSGRTGGRPTADASRKIDLPWLARRGWVAEGQNCHGTISWSSRGRPAGSISYATIMMVAGQERLELSFDYGPEGARESVKQTIGLTSTRPHFGGKRWWMICPLTGARVAKLYMPNGADRFAARGAWKLGYSSQRETAVDRKFSKLFALQEKLGGDSGFGEDLRKPKGMWNRTYERHYERFSKLDAECEIEMAARLRGLQD